MRFAKIFRSLLRPTSIVGFINASHWCWNAKQAGCTGHEMSILMSFAIPVGAGLLSFDPSWYIALVMVLPPIIIFGSSDGLVGYSVLYLANVGFVLAGQFVHRRVLMPLIGEFGQTREKESSRPRL